jgi:cytosine/adenosine deaminase-related metal-dependent hydrolase
MTVGDLDIINAHLVTVDSEWTEIHSGFMQLRGGRITSLGPMSEYQKSSAVQHDCNGSFVFPGLINTHTHSFQTLTRDTSRFRMRGSLANSRPLRLC